MSVLWIPVSVMKMQIALIRTVPTAVPVNRDSLEMDQLVMVSDWLDPSTIYLIAMLTVMHHLFRLRYR